MNSTIPEDLFAALTEAVATALRELAMVECAAIDRAAEADLFAVLPVTTAAGEGAFVLALPEETALALARRVFAEAGIEPDAAVVRDCAGEIVNVVCGQAKTLLGGTPYHFTLSTPRVETGAPAAERAFVIAFGSDAGPFALRVHLPV